MQHRGGGSGVTKAPRCTHAHVDGVKRSSKEELEQGQEQCLLATPSSSCVMACTVSTRRHIVSLSPRLHHVYSYDLPSLSYLACTMYTPLPSTPPPLTWPSSCSCPPPPPLALTWPAPCPQTRRPSSSSAGATPTQSRWSSGQHLQDRTTNALNQWCTLALMGYEWAAYAPPS